MIKTVQWASRSRLSCIGCDKADVILCLKEGLVAPVACAVDESLVPGTSTYSFHTIKAELTNYIQDKNGCNGTFYRYIFSYDTDLIVGGATLRTSDIQGVVCEGCLTQYVDDRVGDEVRLEKDGDTYTLVTQHGCRYEFSGNENSSTFLVTSEGHGLGEDGDIVLLQGNFSFALGNSPSTTADLVARILTPDSFEILSPGIHEFPAHGRILGVWYALSAAILGGSLPSNSLTIDQIRQNAFLPISPDYIFVSLQEAELARVIPEAFNITQNSHGFVAGQIISLSGGVWQPGIAGQVAFFVKEVLDINRFIISFSWSGNVPGLVAGTTYALNPLIPGALIDISLLNTALDPITRVGYSSKANYLAGFIEYPVIV